MIRIIRTKKLRALEDTLQAITDKVQEFEDAIKDAKLQVEKEKIAKIVKQIQEHDKEFNPILVLSEDMSFKTAEKVLEYIFKLKREE